jgi:hypothetical protein
VETSALSHEIKEEKRRGTYGELRTAYSSSETGNKDGDSNKHHEDSICGRNNSRGDRPISTLICRMY